MAKVKQFMVVANVLASFNGKSVTPEQLRAALAGTGVYVSRLATYIWEMKKHEIKLYVNKKGRKVRTYRMPMPQAGFGAVAETAEVEVTAADQVADGTADATLMAEYAEEVAAGAAE